MVLLLVATALLLLFGMAVAMGGLWCANHMLTLFSGVPG